MGNHSIDCDVCGKDLRGLGGGHANGCPANNPANRDKSLSEKKAMYRIHQKKVRYGERYASGPIPIRDDLEDHDKRLDNLEQAIAALPTAISSLQSRVMNGHNAYNALCRTRDTVQTSKFSGFEDILVETLMDGYEAQALLIKKLTDRVEFYKAGPKPEMSRKEMEDRLRSWGYRPTWRECLHRLVRK